MKDLYKMILNKIRGIFAGENSITGISGHGFDNVDIGTNSDEEGEKRNEEI